MQYINSMYAQKNSFVLSQAHGANRISAQATKAITAGKKKRRSGIFR